MMPSPRCTLPTPVEPREALAREVHVGRLYVKRDDRSAPLYGGNKPRKLEFILGRALQEGRREVLTFGFAGSHHTLATAVYAREVGLGSIAILLPQESSEELRRNLLMSHCCGAELHLARGLGGMAREALFQRIRHLALQGRDPLVIPPGGSSSLGTVGFVNAGLELAEQVASGEMPEPDLLYVALGTAGTAMGLKLGLLAAGLRTRVIPVRVVAERYLPPASVLRRFRRTNSLLHRLDPTFPCFDISPDDLGIVNDYLGAGYGANTTAGREACRLARRLAGLQLEGTYTGKALAALLAHAREGRLHNKVVLFWNTHSSIDISVAVANHDPSTLPREFHCFFSPSSRADEGDELDG